MQTGKPVKRAGAVRKCGKAGNQAHHDDPPAYLLWPASLRRRCHGAESSGSIWQAWIRDAQCYCQNHDQCAGVSLRFRRDGRAQWLHFRNKRGARRRFCIDDHNRSLRANRWERGLEACSIDLHELMHDKCFGHALEALNTHLTRLQTGTTRLDAPGEDVFSVSSSLEGFR